MVELKLRKLALICLKRKVPLVVYRKAQSPPRPITFPNLYQRYPRILEQPYAFLFADDTNAVYTNKNLKSLESTVNQELC